MNVLSKIFNSKWVTPILIGISVLLFVTSYKGLYEAYLSKIELAKANQRVEQVEIREQAAYIIADSLNKELKYSKKLLDSSKIEHTIIQRELTSTKRINLSLSQRVKDAKLNKDTASYVEACDSLANQVEVLSDKVTEDSAVTAFVVQQYDKQIVIKDSLLVQKDRLYSSLRSDFINTNNTNKILATSLGLVNNQLKKEKKKNKFILATAITLITGAIIAK